MDGEYSNQRRYVELIAMAENLGQPVATAAPSDAERAARAYAAQRQQRAREVRAATAAMRAPEARPALTTIASAQPTTRALRVSDQAQSTRRVRELEASLERQVATPGTPASALRESQAVRVPIGSKGVRVENDGSVYAQFEDRDRLIGRIEVRMRDRYDDQRRVRAREERSAADARKLAASRDAARIEAARAAPDDQAAQTIRSLAERLGVPTQVDRVRTRRDLAGTLLDASK